MEENTFFNTVGKHYKLKKPFVIYKKPGANKLTAQLLNNADIKPPNYDEEGFLFAPFDDDRYNKIWFPLTESTLIETKIEKIQTKTLGVTNLHGVNKEKHILLIEKALHSLNKNDLQKVVLSRKEEVNLSEVHPLLYFKNACLLYENTFCYCWFHPNVGMWVGATPETLLKLKGKKFKTMALAGTMPYKGTEKVIWGAKEIEEQQIVVDSILNELKDKVAAIKAKKTVTQRAGDLLHLKTPISGTLSASKELQKLIDLLHPTSAVCGLPKLKAKEYILNNEGYDRKYYTGYLGIIKPKASSSLFVNLRCMEIKNNQVSLYIGGGITASSEADKEWQETVNKSQIMKQIL